jgi:hypothetical protein
MEFIFAVVEILVGSFVLFTVAKVTYETLGQRSGMVWVGLVGALAIANMVIHRMIGSTINPPFFTAVLFGIALSGLTPKDSVTVSPWLKRAAYAVAIGTIIGWTSFAEVGTAP